MSVNVPLLRREGGFTLVEVVITVVITSFVVVIFGMVLYISEINFSGGRERLNMQSSMRFARAIFEGNIRKAERVSIYKQGLKVGEAEPIDEVGDELGIKFDGEWRDFRRLNGRLMLMPRYCPDLPVIMLADNVTDVSFAYFEDNEGRIIESIIQITIERETEYDATTGAAVVGESSFKVECRNIRND